MTTESPISNSEDDAGVGMPDSEQELRAERLRQAVRAAGGNRVVAVRANVPLGTLNNYLAGRDMKASALIALARACNVSLDWLATGQEPAAAAVAPAAANIQKPAENLELYDVVDTPRMADALRVVWGILALSGDRWTWLHRAKSVISTYDKLGQPSSPDEKSPAPEDDDWTVIDD